MLEKTNASVIWKSFVGVKYWLEVGQILSRHVYSRLEYIDIHYDAALQIHPNKLAWERILRVC